MHLSIDNHAVAQLDHAPSQGGLRVTHPTLGLIEFAWQQQQSHLAYQLAQDGEVALKRIEPLDKKQSKLNLGTLGLVFKLFKSAGALKAALAGTALAGWAWLFNLEFAIALIVALLIHEFGHIWAMKSSGMKVKGIFLIPFIGGVAVGEAATSRWSEFKIAMAGPWLGSIAAVVAWCIWLVYPHQWLGTFVFISVLINLFNLLPIVPLDGGQAIRAMVFSKPGKIGFMLLLVISAAMVAVSLKAGLYLLVFFGVLGAVDLIASNMRGREYERLVPLTNYGIAFCLTSYVATLVVLVVLSIVMAQSGIEGAKLPLVFLTS